MNSTSPPDAHWPPVGSGLWTRWWGYLARWLVFGVVVCAFQPAGEGPGPYWQQKLYQVALGLLFGFACAVVFTVTENALNTPRIQWKSWAIALATWLVVKVVFVSIWALAQ